jgi:hypothetical protein
VTVWSDGSTTHVTKTWHDDMGRRTFVAENYDNFSPPTTNEGDGTDKSKDRVTAFEYYNGLGKLTKLNAMNQNGNSDDQETIYPNSITIREPARPMPATIALGGSRISFGTATVLRRMYPASSTVTTTPEIGCGARM